MKKLLLLLLVVSAAVFAGPQAPSRELLMPGDGGIVEVTTSTGWSHRLVQNKGSTSIYCALGPQTDGGWGSPASTGFEIQAGGVLKFPSAGRLGCTGASAQDAGAGTRVLGVP
jgi:protein involved in polysaccharide export with SLBB domain